MVHDIEVTVGACDMADCATLASRRFDPFVNVAGLCGLRRLSPVVPEDVFAAWPLPLAALLAGGILGALGFVRAGVS